MIDFAVQGRYWHVGGTLENLLGFHGKYGQNPRVALRDVEEYVEKYDHCTGKIAIANRRNTLLNGCEV